MGAIARVLTVVLTTVIVQAHTYEGTTCWLKDGTPGVCRSGSSCFNKSGPRTSDPWAELCCLDGDDPFFCCPEGHPNYNIDVRALEDAEPSVAKEQCKLYAHLVFWELESPVLLVNAGSYNTSTCAMVAETLIVGGKRAEPMEFPHMAALGFGPLNNIKWMCGGSLISQRYVLTAAHCMHSRDRGAVKWVRLGDLNLARTDDDASPVTIAVAERFPHQGYRPPMLYNDIALLKLEHDVTFSPYIRPACLYNSQGNPSDGRAIISGWGKNASRATQGTDDLMRVEIVLRTPEDCNRLFETVVRDNPRQLGRGVEAESMICAGGTKDTCGGDSGGPLQIKLQKPFCMYSIIGLTSFGVRACGSGTPAIYTRVSNYIPWIQNHVWPKTCQTD